jgi:hypothetical protein
MARNICTIMGAIGAAVLLFSTMAQAQDWQRRPPTHRAPEPLTLVGIGAGVAALFVARRFTRK